MAKRTVEYPVPKAQDLIPKGPCPLYEYAGDCVGGPEEDIRDMEEKSSDMSVAGCMRLLGNHWVELAANLGYKQDDSLAMEADTIAVSCHRSVYQGRPCIYVSHSKIFHIFTRKKGPKDTPTETQRRIVTARCNALRDRLLDQIDEGRVPEDWDGVELTWLLADMFQFETLKPSQFIRDVSLRQRHRKYPFTKAKNRLG